MERDLKENPWKGLASYTYQDADHFYGRDKELDEIASIIKQNAFTTLYGVSGAGKTSIINAGLFPILDKLSYLPIYIRLDHNQGHIGYDSQIIDAVNTALNAIDAELEESIGSKEIHSELDELWLYFHSHQFWTKDNHKITPIIFIDQFEEIFTKNDNPDDIWSFFNVIDSLQYSTPTERLLQIIEHNDQYVQFHEKQNFRMVFTMREDFLARLEDYSYNIPALRKNRIGLKPLNGNQALEVILKPRPDMVTRDVALHIISKITGKNIPDNARRLEATSVDTSILSLFCTELYNYAVKDNKGQITIPLVDLYGGNILEWFYDRNMQILPKKTYIYLENQLLTHSGFRNSVALENLLESGVQQEQLDRLAENRIIRIEDINHNYRVEFTHDVLCKIAKKRRDDRDKVERNKDEQSARRAFTIDNIILFTAFLFQFLALYFEGFEKSLYFSLAVFPLIVFLYLIIIHRTIADQNLSKIILMIFGGIGIEIGIIFLNKGGLINIRYPNTIMDWTAIAISFIIPLIFILTPFLFIIVKKTRLKYLKEKSTHNRTIFTGIYTIYIILLFTFIVCDAKFELLSDGSSGSNTIATCIILITISSLSIIYALLYMKQPKRVAISTYLESVFSFQSFVKYKSFKTRFITIIVCFIIVIFAFISTSYIDVIPFITLPIASLSLLYAARSEISLTPFKKAYLLKTAIIILPLTECITFSQYHNGLEKPWLVYIVSSIITIVSFAFLVYKERIRNRSFFLLRVLLISLFIGFALPLLCIGYNIYNPRFSNISRVWGGRIESDVRNVYLLTIKDNKGKKGVMDNCDIIIYPRYVRIKNFCSINDQVAKSIYPLRYSLIKLLDISDNGSIYNAKGEYGVPIFSLGYNSTDSVDENLIDGYEHLNGLDFLTFDNRYGRSFVDLWIRYKQFDDFTRSDNYQILSRKNKCISEESKREAAINIFIQALYKSITKNSYYRKLYDNSSYYEISSEFDNTKSLRECIKEVSLKPLCNIDSTTFFDNLYSASMSVDYLFACGIKEEFNNIILENLWDKLSKDSKNITAIEDKAYFYLLSGQTEKAMKYAEQCLKNNPRSINALSNYLLSFYVKNEQNSFGRHGYSITDYKNILTNDQKRLLLLNIIFKLRNLRTYNNFDNYRVLTYVTMDLDINTYGIIFAFTLGHEEPWYKELALRWLAKDSYYESAIYCMDRAILLHPNNPDYYDTKGYLLLLQGKEQEAKNMYYRVKAMKHYYYQNNYSDLINLLNKRGLIKKEEEQEIVTVEEEVTVPKDRIDRWLSTQK